MDHSSYLPLQEPTFLILLSLSGGEKHGYAILKDVSELSGGRVQLSTGTLYGALNRLLDQGFITRVDEEGPRGKKAYRLERDGRLVFEAEADRLRSLLAAIQRAGEGRAAA